MVNEDFEPREEEEAVLSVLAEENRANPYLIREKTGLDKGTTNTALTRLTSAGWVRKVTRGLYEFVEDPRDVDETETTDETPAEQLESADDSRSAPAEPEPPAAADVDALIDEVADDILPGSGEKLEARREALHAVVDYLREHGKATPKDFKNDVYPDYPAYYTEGSDPPYSWWTNAMIKGLSELAERTEKIGAADHSGQWTWRGETDE